MRWGQGELLIKMRDNFKERLKIVKSSGSLTIFFGMQSRHQNFLPAGRVHLLSDNLLDFLKHPYAKRQELVNPRHQFVNKTGARKKHGIFRHLVFRRLAYGPAEKLGLFHKSQFS